MRWRTPVALTAAFVLGTVAAGLPDRHKLPGYVGTYRWVQDDPEFGGFSGIDISDDGRDFAALTDRGAIVMGRFNRDSNGTIIAVDAGPPRLLAEPPGEVAEGYRFDTEGLALAKDGSFYVSIEFFSRVLHYRQSDQVPEVLPIPPDFALMGQNRGPEALAIDSQGTLYTMPEESKRPDGAYPVYRFRNGVWDQPFLIRGGGTFLAAGGDIGPDGRLYLLERQFRGIAGFASRVRRIDIVESGIAPDEVLIQTPPGYFDNLEGIAVWRDPEGAMRLTLISDDNFVPVLTTEIVEFRVPD